MADILIRGMEMPKEGEKILISAGGSVWVNAWPTRGYMRMEDVYAVPLPAGHGRLIDANELELDLVRHNGAIGFELIGNAPTIVPADGGNTDGN